MFVTLVMFLQVPEPQAFVLEIHLANYAPDLELFPRLPHQPCSTNDDSHLGREGIRTDSHVRHEARQHFTPFVAVLDVRTFVATAATMLARVQMLLLCSIYRSTFPHLMCFLVLLLFLPR
jgi:hypothetical protein